MRNSLNTPKFGFSHDFALDLNIKNFVARMVNFWFFQKATRIWHNLPLNLNVTKACQNEEEDCAKSLWPSQKTYRSEMTCY